MCKNLLFRFWRLCMVTSPSDRLFYHHWLSHYQAQPVLIIYVNEQLCSLRVFSSGFFHASCICIKTLLAVK